MSFPSTGRGGWGSPPGVRQSDDASRKPRRRPPAPGRHHRALKPALARPASLRAPPASSLLRSPARPHPFLGRLPPRGDTDRNPTTSLPTTEPNRSDCPPGRRGTPPPAAPPGAASPGSPPATIPPTTYPGSYMDCFCEDGCVRSRPRNGRRAVRGRREKLASVRGCRKS